MRDLLLYETYLLSGGNAEHHCDDHDHDHDEYDQHNQNRTYDFDFSDWF